MAKISTMWLTDAMSGRADRTSNTYTKIDRITGRVYAVTLRNPVSGKDFNNNQIKANNKFGALCMGISAWVKAAKAADADAADKAQYEKFVKALKSQNNYPTVRALIMGKRYATVNEELSAVTIADGEYTKTVEFVFNARPLIDGQDDPDFGNGSSGSNSGSNGSNSGSAEIVRLTVSAGQGGQVKIGDGAFGAGGNVDVAAGTSVSIAAQASEGYTFSQWSDGNTNASRNVTVNSALTLTASFTSTSGGGGNTGEGPSE